MKLIPDGIMKRVIILIILTCAFCSYCFSQTINNRIITLEIINVIENGGTIYVSIYSNEQSYRNRQASFSFQFEANSTIISHELTIPHGEYAIAMFQDSNNNGRLDYGLFGIPRELVGMSNYFGRGFPANNFDKLKIFVNNTTEKITVGLYRF